MSYNALDAAIISAIRAGKRVHYDKEVVDYAELHTTRTGRNPFLVIDGRLTALKRAGLIEFVRPEPGMVKRWRLVSA